MNSKMNKQICSYYKEDMNMKRKIILAVITAALILRNFDPAQQKQSAQPGKPLYMLSLQPS